MNLDPYGKLAGLIDRITTLAQNPETAAEAAALANALLMVLGSGPTVAAIESLIIAGGGLTEEEREAMAHAQRALLLGMADMAKAVAELMDPANPLYPSLTGRPH